MNSLTAISVLGWLSPKTYRNSSSVNLGDNPSQIAPSFPAAMNVVRNSLRAAESMAIRSPFSTPISSKARAIKSVRELLKSPQVSRSLSKTIASEWGLAAAHFST